MSPKCLPNNARREIIQANILTHSYDELAEMCGCNKRTILRDVKEWRIEGGFEQLLFDRFLQLYPKVEAEYPDKALDKLVYLMAKGMTQKIQTEGNLNISGINEGISSLIKFSKEDEENADS